MNEKPASFASKVTSIKIDLRQVRFWYPLLLIIPISDFLLYPSHTCLSVSYSVCSCEGCEGCPFFCLDAKEQKIKIVFVLFSWKKRTKSSRLRLLSYSVSSFRCARRKLASLRQPRFFNAPLGRPLNASSVRPKQLKIENWQLKIYKAGLHGVFNSPLSLGNACRGAACCASIPMRQDKTINNTISPFVFYWLLLDCVKRRYEAQHAAPLPSQGKFHG